LCKQKGEGDNSDRAPSQGGFRLQRLQNRNAASLSAGSKTRAARLGTAKGSNSSCTDLKRVNLQTEGGGNPQPGIPIKRNRTAA